MDFQHGLVYTQQRFNGRILETLGALSSDQLNEVDDVLDEGGGIVPEDLKRSE